LTEDENFEALKIKFSDRHHAAVKIFGEKLSAVLVSLPTTIETHRTVDGSHLFKSAAEKPSSVVQARSVIRLPARNTGSLEQSMMQSQLGLSAD
jgi:TATA-binding protein-associated factor Taf7